MVITPDNRTLIISESFAGRLTAFDIDPDGGLSGRRVFADGLGPDGITMEPKARSGSERADSPWSVSPRAAKSCSASNSPSTGRRSR
jgi:hypothetical protein